MTLYCLTFNKSSGLKRRTYQIFYLVQGTLRFPIIRRRTIQLKHEGGGVCLWTTVSQDHLVGFHPTDNPLRPESHQWNHCHLSRLQGKIARSTMRNLSLAYKSFHATSLMCLWSMRMVSIYNGAKGNPGVDESFAKGQYCIYTLCGIYEFQYITAEWSHHRRLSIRCLHDVLMTNAKAC